MEVVFRVNANELDINFLESIKQLFKEKEIYINISTKNKNMSETDYLLSNPANASRLLKAIDNIEKNKDKLIYKKLEDLEDLG
jgi:PHD/YefM family antitoxin component YafN of YafNO toxin-antitoxin module